MITTDNSPRTEASSQSYALPPIIKLIHWLCTRPTGARSHQVRPWPCFCRIADSSLWIGAVLSLLFASSAAFGQKVADLSPGTMEALERLEGSVLVEGQAYEYDRQLSDGIGPRLTGSDSYAAAVRLASEKLRGMNLDDVHLEPFVLPNGWEPESVTISRMTRPRKQELHLHSMGWSPSTPLGGVKGDVWYAPNLLSTDELRANSDKIRGNIVLIDPSSFGKKLLVGSSLAGAKMLQALGAKAAIYGGATKNNVESTLGFTFDGTLSTLPMAQLGNEDFTLLRRLSEQGPVTVEFAFKNKTSGSTQVNNVVAEIRGREKPDEWILIGAHLDSWQSGTGAQDNGTGVATILEAARAIHALGRPPKRSLRFVLFGGEEQGLVGSKAYVNAHVAELDKCTAVLITDLGSAAPHGWAVFGREDVKLALQPIREVLAGVGGEETSDDATFLLNSDHSEFLARGIPAVLLWPDLEPYLSIHHKPGDTFDKVNRHTLAEGAVIVATTAYAIADSDEFAPRLSQAEVEELLKKEGKYDEYIDLKEHGLF